MVTWERHAFPGLNEFNGKQEVIDWYDDIIGDYFDVTAAGLRDDIFDDIFLTAKVKNSAGGYIRARVGTGRLSSTPTMYSYGFSSYTAYGISDRPVEYFADGVTKINIVPSESGVNQKFLRSIGISPSEELSPFYVDIATIGDTVLVRFTYQYVRSFALFVFYSGTTIDGDSTDCVYCLTRAVGYNSTTPIPNDGITGYATFCSALDQSAYQGNENYITDKYTFKNNKDNADRYIIRPVYEKGFKGLYYIDGGRSDLGVNMNFTMNGQEWYHIWLNLCVKVG